MAPKKRQPFYFFMLDVQKKQKERGKHYSLREMPAIASPLWANISSNEKKKYEDMAKYFNQQENGSESVKTCHGVDYNELEKEVKQEASKEKIMKEDVRQIIKQALLKNTLVTKNFYLIHVNYFCKSKGQKQQLKYDAAELAILEFSLQDGIGRGMHTIMKLDSLPYGYTYDAQVHTSQTHNLPLPPSTIGTVGIREAVFEVIKFINYNDDEISSPIFTFDEHIPVVRSVFQDVIQNLRTTSPVDLRIYSMSELLFHLKNTTSQHAVTTATSPPFVSVYLAENYLELGTFDYAEGLPCEFHVENDRVSHCSQTKVRGWAYSIIRCCAPDLGIEFMEGKHEPEGSLPTVQVKIPDDESVFTATDFTEGTSTHYRSTTVEDSKVNLNSTRDSMANSSRDFMANSTRGSGPATQYSDDFSTFPQLRDLKRGKGRGNLV